MGEDGRGERRGGGRERIIRREGREGGRVGGERVVSGIIYE